jgi:tetratricopeptide (TPR) repeat protein
MAAWMNHNETSIGMLPILALALLVIGCSGDPGDPAGSGDTGSSALDNREKKELAQKLQHEFDALEADILAALKDRDWPLANRKIALGVEKTSAAGYQFEIMRARFLLQKGNLLRDQGDEVAARRNYADAMAIFRVHGSQVGRFEVHLAQCQLEEFLGAYAAASRDLAEARVLLSKTDDVNLKAAFLIRSGRLAFRQVKYDEAFEAFLEASRIYAQAKDRTAQADALVLLSDVEDAKGDASQCRRSLEKALAIFEKSGNKGGEVRALHKLATLAERDKRYRKARALFNKVYVLYEELDRPSDATKILQHINALPERGKKKKKAN